VVLFAAAALEKARARGAAFSFVVSVGQGVVSGHGRTGKREKRRGEEPREGLRREEETKENEEKASGRDRIE
jgi:aryl-alcohol dehydrogenase-like predicted oxidoreductase